MKNLSALLKVNFKTSIRMGGMMDTPLKKIGYGLLFLILAVMLAGSYAFGMYAMARDLPAELQIFTLFLGVSASYIAVIFIGSFSMFGNIFAAKDTKFLLTLPISHRTLYTSKFLVTYATNSLIAVAIMLINGVVYSMFAPTSALFFPFLVIIALTIAFIPLTAASLIAFAIVKISQKLPFKNFFAILFSLLGLTGYLVLQMTIQNEVMNGITMNADITAGLIDGAMTYFPPFAFILNALSDSSIIDMLLHLAVTAVFFYLSSLFCSWGYAKSVSFSQSAKKKKSGKVASYKSTATKSVLNHFIINEIRSLLRTPIYAINSLSGLFVGPIVIIMPTMTAGESVDFSLILNSIPSYILILVLAAIMTFISALSPAMATIISREGKAFKQLKILPIRPSTIVFGKFIACYLISFLNIIVIAVAAYFAIGIDVIALILASLLANLVTIPLCALDAIVDILRPKLDWINEARAIKQNANVFISMLLNVVLLGIIIAGVIFVSSNIYIIFALGAILTVLSLVLLNVVATKRFSKIRY